MNFLGGLEQSMKGLPSTVVGENIV